MECVTKTDGEDINVGDIRIGPGHRLGGKAVLSDGISIADGMSVSISADLAYDDSGA